MTATQRTASETRAVAPAKPCNGLLFPPEPGPSVPAAYLRQHRGPVTALLTVAGADLAVIAGHASLPWGYAGVGAACAAGAAVTGWRYRPAARRRPRARRAAWSACTACTAAMMAGTAAGVANGWGQAVMLGGGLAVAAPALWHSRKRAAEPEPAPAPEPAPVPVVAPAGPDPRLEAFGARFCKTGTCKGARLHSIRDVRDGFSFELELPAGSDAVTADVMGLIRKIAALYDVSADQVTVEYTEGRSERRALVTVLTKQNAWARADKWDGKSTYDPATGMVRIGRFADGEPAHWLLHQPGSGATGGVIAGTMGAGKTGSFHVIECEAGLAKVNGKRIIALWMGDPQRQPLGVWKGRSDLMAWGPEACVQMIIMAFFLMRDRAARFGEQTWTDHLGRVNAGKGSFDPTPEDPIVDMSIDEWPIIVSDPVLFRIAAPMIAAIIKEGRKVGVKVKLLAQMPDLTQLGLREIRELLKAWNILSHRTDGLSKHMLGVQGDTSKLAPGVHGLGYLHGVDGRPAAVMRTKNLPEYVKPGEDGPDVRELAERISVDPVELGEAIEAVIRPLGWTGRLQVLDGSQMGDAIAEAMASGGGRDKLTPEAAVAALRRVVRGEPAPPRPAAPASADGLPLPPPSRPVAIPLLAAWLASKGEMDVFDVSEMADTDAFSADMALRDLVAVGVAEDLGGGRYRSLVRAN